ncbi:N-acetylgalactosamine-6-sulfatase [Persicitalea jodogahamensis]|uniref:N-acetylgalactosamine-6-sulfatase n=1 Tax=Persicitalea jodogahamensis TaxID=402147 RepID=A0A8J3DDH7_9BACT|nr:N-acetylgalactosamine-6-sulfatase [Persicitalea jodogahamensis]
MVYPAFSQNSPDKSRPNIVIILADDMGYGDLGCYGAKGITTPRIDALAKQGARLTAFYSNGPECTPTRTALLTGRYQQRAGGLECAIGLGNIGRYPEAKALSDKGELGLPTDMSALPTMLKERGYRTAIVGKWHLGEGAAYRPAAHGFDYAIGPLGGAVDYFHHTEPVGVFLGTMMEGNHDFYRQDQPHQRAGTYMTHLLTNEAVEWLNIQKKEEPFFLYVPYTTPHEPYQGADDYQPDKLGMDRWSKGDTKTYARMIEDLDRGVGQILDKLKEKGFAENTLVVFFSDNGPTTIGSAGPFSGNKGHVFEGGIRVPAIVHWPGKVPAGVVSDQPFISMDITASLAALTDAKPRHKLDGVDMVGHLVSGKKDYDRNLFWRKKRAAQVRSAVRSGDLKYILDIDEGKRDEYLFDLKADPGEKNNLLQKRPADAERLRKLLHEWEAEVKPERM